MVWRPDLHTEAKNVGFNLENLEKQKKTGGGRNTKRHTEKQAKEGYGKKAVIYQGNFYRGMQGVSQPCVSTKGVYFCKISRSSSFSLFHRRRRDAS
jgi:hypothetical protein